MATHKVFEYAVIRLVPIVEREEFINVGVVLFSKELNYIGVKFTMNVERIKAFAPQLDIVLIQEYFDSFQMIVNGEENGGEIATYDTAERFRWLTATRSTILQCSKVHPGFCQEPSSKLNQLFEDLV